MRAERAVLYRAVEGYNSNGSFQAVSTGGGGAGTNPSKRHNIGKPNEGCGDHLSSSSMTLHCYRVGLLVMVLGK